MTNERLAEFKRHAEDLNFMQSGYICLGPGQRSPTLTTELNIPSTQLYMLSNRVGDITNNWEGNSDDASYYLLTESWHKLFDPLIPISTMTQDRRNHFLRCSKERRDVYPGFIYVGRGQLSTTLEKELGVTQDDIYMESSDVLYRGRQGNDCDHDYFLREEVWTKMFNKKFNFTTLDERLAYAKTFIGKKIRKTRGVQTHLVLTIKDVRLHTAIFSAGSVLAIGTGEKSTTDLISRDGYVMKLVSDSQDISIPIDFEDLEAFEIAPDPVKINGYEAKDEGQNIRFGCAVIPKDTLRTVRDLMKQATPGEFKKVESVMIGKGQFTLEIIDKLLA